jgi:hypothetical protein
MLNKKVDLLKPFKINNIFGTKIVYTMKSLFLWINKTVTCMKKFAVILLITFVSAMVVSSCNKKECPAYSKATTEQAGRNV